MIFNGDVGRINERLFCNNSRKIIAESKEFHSLPLSLLKKALLTINFVESSIFSIKASLLASR